MENDSLFSWLIKHHPGAKKNTLRAMLEARRVLINGAVAKSLKQPLGAKDKVEVLDVAEAKAGGGMRATLLGEGLKMVYFDSEIIVVDKPSSLLTATDEDERRPTAWRILSEWFQRQNHKNQVHLIHRLDRDASGLLVFARTAGAFESLKRQFFEHTITRRYDVLVRGIPKKATGRMEHLLREDARGMVHVTQDKRVGKPAILDYEVVEANQGKKIAHLKCTLFTGRKHQIRVQLKAAGHGVLGDPVYGPAVPKGAPAEPPGRLALHASHLVLAHPRTGKPVSFDSVMPGSFGHVIRG